MGKTVRSGARLRVRRGCWHYRFQLRSKEYTGNTGLEATASNRTAAESFAQRKFDALLHSTVQTSAMDISFVDAAADFQIWCETVEYRQKPNTWKRIKVSFVSLLTFFYERKLHSITAADIEQYKNWRLNDLKVREITLRHDLHNLSVFLRYARKQQWIEGNPLEDVSIPSDRDAVRQIVLTKEEEEQYFAVARNFFDRKKRRNLYDLGRLMILQGCRPEELLALRKEHVAIEAAQLTVVAGKTRASRRTIDLVAESVDILRPRLEGESEWVFPSDRKPGQHLTKVASSHDAACRESGVSFTPYDFRHTFATRLIESAAADVPTVAAILGHNGLRTIYRYVHPSAGHKKAAMEKFEAALLRHRLKAVNE